MLKWIARNSPPLVLAAMLAACAANDMGMEFEDLVVDEGGLVWVLSPNNNALYRFNPVDHSLAYFTMPTPNSHPKSIVTSSDGTLWFVQPNVNKVGSFDPRSEEFSEFEIPIAFFNPEGVVVDHRGTVWFTGLRVNRLGAFYPETGVFNEVIIPTPRGLPNSIEVDSAGNLYFLEYMGNKVGVFNPTEATFSEFVIPTFNSLPDSIAMDSGRGVLWFTETSTEARKLGMLSLKDVSMAATANAESSTDAGASAVARETGNTGTRVALKVVAALALALGAYLLYSRRVRRA